MTDLTWAQGTALLILIYLACAVAYALVSTRRPDRKWLKRLHAHERARIDWQARVVRSQSFWRDL